MERVRTVGITDAQVVSAVELKVCKSSLVGLLIRTNGKIGKNKWEINTLDRAYFNILF